MVVVVGIGEILDVPAEFFIGGHHGQGLIVHIGGNALLGHDVHDFLPLGLADAGNSRQIQVAGAAEMRFRRLK